MGYPAGQESRCTAVPLPLEIRILHDVVHSAEVVQVLSGRCVEMHWNSFPGGGHVVRGFVTRLWRELCLPADVLSIYLDVSTLLLLWSQCKLFCFCDGLLAECRRFGPFDCSL